MKQRTRHGIFFWLGAGVYCCINIALIPKGESEVYILRYNYLIAGVAVVGVLLNIFLYNRSRQKKKSE